MLAVMKWKQVGGPDPRTLLEKRQGAVWECESAIYKTLAWMRHGNEDDERLAERVRNWRHAYHKLQQARAPAASDALTPLSSEATLSDHLKSGRTQEALALVRNEPTIATAEVAVRLVTALVTAGAREDAFDLVQRMVDAHPYRYDGIGHQAVAVLLFHDPDMSFREALELLGGLQGRRISSATMAQMLLRATRADFEQLCVEAEALARQWNSSTVKFPFQPIHRIVAAAVTCAHKMGYGEEAARLLAVTHQLMYMQDPTVNPVYNAAALMVQVLQPTKQLALLLEAGRWEHLGPFSKWMALWSTGKDTMLPPPPPPPSKSPPLQAGGAARKIAPSESGPTKRGQLKRRMADMIVTAAAARAADVAAAIASGAVAANALWVAHLKLHLSARADWAAMQQLVDATAMVRKDRRAPHLAQQHGSDQRAGAAPPAAAAAVSPPQCAESPPPPPRSALNSHDTAGSADAQHAPLNGSSARASAAAAADTPLPAHSPQPPSVSSSSAVSSVTAPWWERAEADASPFTLVGMAHARLGLGAGLRSHRWTRLVHVDAMRAAAAAARWQDVLRVFDSQVGRWERSQRGMPPAALELRLAAQAQLGLWGGVVDSFELAQRQGFLVSAPCVQTVVEAAAAGVGLSPDLPPWAAQEVAAHVVGAAASAGSLPLWGCHPAGLLNLAHLTSTPMVLAAVRCVLRDMARVTDATSSGPPSSTSTFEPSHSAQAARPTHDPAVDLIVVLSLHIDKTSLRSVRSLAAMLRTDFPPVQMEHLSSGYTSIRGADGMEQSTGIVVSLSSESMCRWLNIAVTPPFEAPTADDENDDSDEESEGFWAMAKNLEAAT